jgi:hypothetical protein
VREHTYGKGKVIWGVPLRDILAQRGIGPDFAYSGAADLDFIHRRTAGYDIYFVRNKKEEWAEADCTFRVRGRAPELWDPVTGGIQGARVAYTAAGSQVALKLPPNGSMFVVFRAGKERPVPKSAGSERSHHVSGPWEVSFQRGLGAPTSLRFEKLISWTDHPEPAVRFFSGTATYRNKIEVPAEFMRSSERIYLDLGEIRFIARVRVNGKPSGIAWTAPYRVDITNAARAGANDIEIEVANTWSNRITGDAQGAEKKYTSINLPWSKDTPLLRSGLMGPVRVIVT